MKGDNFPMYGTVYCCTLTCHKKTFWLFFLLVVSTDTKWQLGKNDVRERLAQLRASGDFSDCVLTVGSDENVEVCILSLSVIKYYNMLCICLLVYQQKLCVTMQYGNIFFFLDVALLSFMCLCVCVCVCVYLYTYIHTYIHTYRVIKNDCWCFNNLSYTMHFR